ncbi:unnamed protein product, partial [Rotaria sp. Silwood1]
MNNISEHLSSNFSSEPPRGSSSVLAKQQQSTVDNRFTLVYLKRAISNNLPCFYLQFEEDLTIDQLPSTTKVATELNQIFSNKWKSSFKGFTICSLLEKNRFKIGTNDKIDYFNLINTKWPDEIDNNVVKLNKSNYSPDYFAFVVRYVSSSMSKEQVIKYIYQAFHSAVQFTEIKYYKSNSRSMKDYRFVMTDLKEYYAALRLERIAIGNQLLPFTQFRSGYKLTYCTKCC